MFSGDQLLNLYDMCYRNNLPMRDKVAKLVTSWVERQQEMLDSKTAKSAEVTGINSGEKNNV